MDDYTITGYITNYIKDSLIAIFDFIEPALMALSKKNSPKIKPVYHDRKNYLIKDIITRRELHSLIYKDIKFVYDPPTEHTVDNSTYHYVGTFGISIEDVNNEYKLFCFGEVTDEKYSIKDLSDSNYELYLSSVKKNNEVLLVDELLKENPIVSKIEEQIMNDYPYRRYKIITLNGDLYEFEGPLFRGNQKN